MNYSELFNEGRDALSRAHIAEAALDARLLLEYICHTDRNTLLAHPELEVSEINAQCYRLMIEKRAAHTPLQHLTGECDFMGLTFKVTRDTLIPRQDTEFVVEEALTYAEDGMKVLDVCTGSGCILLSIMKYRNVDQGDGVDVSDEALEIAKMNAEGLGIKANFYHSNLFDDLPEEKYDLIISNPPYIKSDVIKTLMPEVRDHEPHLALDGGADGLIFYRKIASKAKEYLSNYGRLYFEIGYDEGSEVRDILRSEGYQNIELKSDYAGNPRVVYASYIHNY